MELVLKRIAKRPKYTIGKLYIDGKYFCDTLEDCDRGLTSEMSEEKIRNIKVYARTAIPTGKYKLTLNVQSPKFSKKAAYRFCDGFLPRLNNVKGYEGILIHIGNTADDSAGCILVGENNVVGKVLNSTATFRKLYDILNDADRRDEKITIEVKNK